MKYRKEQIQEIVENTLLEFSGALGAVETGYDLGMKDLFSGAEALAHELYTTKYRIQNATHYGLPAQAVSELKNHAARIEAALKSPVYRRAGRALGVGVGVGKGLGKSFAIGIPMGIASSLAGNLASKLTNDYAYMNSSSQGREPSIPDLPEFGLEINR